MASLLDALTGFLAAHLPTVPNPAPTPAPASSCPSPEPLPSPATTPLTSTMVEIPYAELVDPSFSLGPLLASAYGPLGLGILAVSGVPSLSVPRAVLLRLSRSVSLLPPAARAATSSPGSYFQVGWSHGNEVLQGGRPDWAKGSFYANVLEDVPEPSDEEMVRKYPSFLAPNIWPSESLPELEPAFKALGELVVSTGRLVARHADAYVATQIDGYEEGRLERLLNTSRTAKGRLLHYYPVEDVAAMMGEEAGGEGEGGGAGGGEGFGDWCGWHSDHGSLTGLVPALYLDRDGNEVPNPDPDAGLYIRGRDGSLIKAVVPPGAQDVLLFQIGETAQVHTGGVLQATPHAVKGARGRAAEGVSRETFAVFMEPEFDGDMSLPEGRTIEDVQGGEAVKFLPPSVRTLGSRWKEGMDFGAFSEATFSTFFPNVVGEEEE